MENRHPPPITRWGARLGPRLALVALAGLVTGCGDTTPTAPDGDGTGGVSVASVAVTSSIGALIGIDGRSQLDAVITGDDGSTLTRSVTWSSDGPGIATVSAAGLLTGVSEGSVSISATADGVTGTFAIRIVDADLAGIESLLGDPFAAALLDVVDGGPGTPLGDTWAACSAARAAGNLTELNSCLGDARNELASHSDPESGPVAGLLDVFVTWLDRLLNL